MYIQFRVCVFGAVNHNINTNFDIILQSQKWKLQIYSESSCSSVMYLIKEAYNVVKCTLNVSNNI